jgi:drug/metabolite transporter (DMT)-like permease
VSSGLIYTLLALLSYSTLGVLHKIADVKGGRPAAINVLLYLSSLLILLFAGIFTGVSPFTGPLSAKLLALPFGVCSAIAILALQTALRFGNISTSWLAINLSAGVPTIASILLYHEPMNLRKGVSLLLIAAAMFLLWKDKVAENRKIIPQTAAQKTP